MADEKIIDWPALSDAQAEDDTRLVATGIVGTGKLYSGTIAQLKKVFQTRVKNYTGLGSEGSTLTLSELAGRRIVGIWREGTYMYPVVSAPDSVSYTFDTTSIVFGNAIGLGERFAIHYNVI